MFSSITSAFGLSAPPPSPTPTFAIVAEPDTTSVTFPALNSQQRAKSAPKSPTTSASSPSSLPPSFSLSPPSLELPPDDEDAAELPDLEVDGRGARSTADKPISSALAPPTSTVKANTAAKGRVRVEKGFSQLDWAKLNRKGEVDLRGGVTELRHIPPEELALHNTEDDCWQAYDGKVYNVGPFLRYHPGGGGEMMRAAGKDATSLFMLAHAWVNYDALLENCLVGYLGRGY